MKVANFGLQPSFHYFTRLFGSKKGKVARLQWYLKTGFAGQIFDRAKQRIRSANVQTLLAIILDRRILAKCVLLILENK